MRQRAENLWIDGRRFEGEAYLTRSHDLIFSFDTHPDRQIILKEPRLYFAWRGVKQFALLATDVDDAENRMESVSIEQKRLTMEREPTLRK